MFVTNPQQPEWGRGQVQSRIGARVTVNVENAGKVVIDGTRVDLHVTSDASIIKGRF